MVAIKSAYVSEFGGKSLSYRERGTQIIEDYKSAEVSKLKEWYKSQTNMSSIHSLTIQPQGRMDMTHNREQNENSISDKLRVSKLSWC